ncbi:putative harbinger transposase-derived protein [Helianthus annuus]|nr:putative harbinger transposase-derived protein [Helianthus annuus]KAJ0618894.1 putative harbinger transposase-derived protein [Helianthus annuus]KAJ0777350.1 putative harbinger transposase-derived protein [Helianthus annuus]
MDSPSSSSMLNYCYHDFFADGDGSTDEEVEQEAVTGACKLAMRYSEHCRRPQAKKGKRGYIERDRRGAHDRLMKDYFDEEPTYSNEMFRRRFRMSKRLFLRIVHDLEANYDFFKQKSDARGELGFTGIQKCTSALRILAYGNTTDINDEYLKMGEKTTRDSLEHFCRGIIDVYGARYLRTPTWEDLQKIYEVHNAEHGLPGMIGSIDCMHNMILEDEGKARCQNYVPEAVQEEHPQASMEERVNNARELRYEPYHSQLMVDLLHHAWSVRYVPPEGEEETEDEGEESEDEN